MYTIRLYQDSDFAMLHRWFNKYGEMGPVKEMLPLDSSFILEIDETPALFVTVILTNAKYCYFTNYGGNSLFKGQRDEASQVLLKHVQNFIKEKGYVGLIALPYKPKVIEQFKKHGWSPTISGLQAFVTGVE